MLVISHPPSYELERSYIFDVIFDEFLGLDYEREVIDTDKVQLRLKDEQGKKTITLPDVFFSAPEALWLQERSLPKTPLEVYDLENPAGFSIGFPDNIPVIYGSRLSNGSFINNAQRGIELGIDIFGSAFFMLTRYEEIVNKERDEHERFSAKSSIAYREGFLNLPIINVYVELLWNAMKQTWPLLERKVRKFRMLASHDVDWPFNFYGKSFTRSLKSVGGILAHKKNVPLAAVHFRSLLKVVSGKIDADVNNTFDYIMDVSEEHGIRSAFNFITSPKAEIDGNYSLDHPFIKGLIRRIYERGHEIGLHTGYYTFRDGKRIREEFDILRAVCDREGIDQEVWGGRQHYLRWENPITWQLWEDAGIDYDSSLSFADCAGFRSGTCYEYPVFNLITRRKLNLRERPLVLMECTVLDEHYMRLTHEQALESMKYLRDQCRRFDGDFTVLWHNSRLVDQKEAHIYGRLIADTQKHRTA